MVISSNVGSAVFAVLGFLLLATTYLADPQFVGRITAEDALAENVSALFYAGGLAVSLYALYMGRAVWLAGLWAVLCLLFLGEETSWFQRFFGYSVPYVEARSTQSEFNLHNFDFFGHGKGRFLDADGNIQFTHESILSTQNLFRAGFFGYFLVLPLSAPRSAAMRRSWVRCPARAGENSVCR